MRSVFTRMGEAELGVIESTVTSVSASSRSANSSEVIPLMLTVRPVVTSCLLRSLLLRDVSNGSVSQLISVEVMWVIGQRVPSVKLTSTTWSVSMEAGKPVPVIVSG